MRCDVQTTEVWVSCAIGYDQWV